MSETPVAMITVGHSYKKSMPPYRKGGGAKPKSLKSRILKDGDLYPLMANSIGRCHVHTCKHIGVHTGTHIAGPTQCFQVAGYHVGFPAQGQD